MNCQGLARRAEDFAGQSFPRAQPGPRWRKDRASREEVCRAPGLSSRAAVSGRRCPAAADLPVEGRRQVPEPGRPPAEVTTNEEQGRPGWAETLRGAPPPPGWLRTGSGAAGAWGRPRDSVSDPRARSQGVRRLPFGAEEARWATQPEDAGLRRGGRERRKEPGWNCGVRRSAGTSADRRARLVGDEHLHAARRALSHRGGRVLARCWRIRGENGQGQPGSPSRTARAAPAC